MSGSVFKDRAVYEGEGQAAVRAGRGVRTAPAPRRESVAAFVGILQKLYREAVAFPL